MISWIREHLSNKFVIALIASVFIVTTFACFTMATTDVHTSELNTACVAIMNLADNIIIKTGVVLMMMVVIARLSTRAGISLTPLGLDLFVTGLHGPPFYKQVLSREYSYLSKLFSSGIIHSKLHSIAV